MDIHYDPDEEQADDVAGTIDYSVPRDCWSVTCSEHGLVEEAPDGSKGSHDGMVYRWVRHMQEEHHGDGKMSLDERMMLFASED